MAELVYEEQRTTIPEPGADGLGNSKRRANAPPAVESGNNAGNEVGTVAGTSQQPQPLQSQIHGNRIESDDE